MKISSKSKKNEIKINSISPVSKHASMTPLSKYSPPRFRRYLESPRRFKITSSNNKKKSLNPSLSSSPCNKSLNIIKESSNHDFKPITPHYIFLSDPDSLYDLNSKSMQKVKNDLSTLINSQRIKNAVIVNKLKSIKKNCKDLTRLIIKETRKEREQLEKVEIKKQLFHEKNAEFFKEVKDGNFFQVQTLLVMHPELIQEVDSTMQTALH